MQNKKKKKTHMIFGRKEYEDVLAGHIHDIWGCVCITCDVKLDSIKCQILIKWEQKNLHTQKWWLTLLKYLSFKFQLLSSHLKISVYMLPPSVFITYLLRCKKSACKIVRRCIREIRLTSLTLKYSLYIIIF